MLRIQCKCVYRLTLVASYKIRPHLKIHGFICPPGDANLAQFSIKSGPGATLAPPSRKTKPWILGRGQI